MTTGTRIEYRANPLRQGSRNRRGDQVDRDFDATLLELLGATPLLMRFDKSGTTLTDRSRHARTLTWSEELSSFDTSPAELGSGYRVHFNGTDEEGDIPDADGLSFGDGASDGPLSIVAIVNQTATAGIKTLLSKYDVTTGSNKREWWFYLDASEKLVLELYDESTGARIGRLYNTALASGAELFVAATYDGSGASTGIRLYSAASRVDDTDSNSGVYTAMENTASLVRLGFTQGASAGTNFFKGSQALVALTGKQLSEDEVWALKGHCNGYFGLSL